MGKLFTLDSSTRATIRDALDDIITEFGKDCRIIYPARWLSCANCIIDPIGKKSSNRWKHGGPVPFQSGSICPLCSGAGGQHSQEVSDTIRLKIEWEPRRFFKPFADINVRAPYSVCETKGYLSDYQKLISADRMVIQLPIEPYSRVEFRLNGIPISPGNIIQDRFVLAYWESRG